MEVVVTETGQLEFSNLTRHCVLHAVRVLAPHGVHVILPASGSHKIRTFCKDLSELMRSKSTKKIGLDDILIPTLDVHRFYEGALSVEDFTMLIEKRILETAGVDLDVESLQKLCWQYYATERKGDITYPKWLSPECTYRLWTIFNCVLDRKLTVQLPQLTVNEVLKRLLGLCGYTWNEKYGYSKLEALEFPDYLDTITSYFDKLRLETSLTCEVIVDMVDEIVHGVLRKGYLTKKGHKVKSWKRRWFVLQRTILQYFKSREKLQLKGQLVLNGKTEVKSIPDKGTRRYRFGVTCGHTGVLFEISADDQRMKHDWMLAIRKAIALAKVLEGGDVSSRDELCDSLAGFYLLKYGMSQPSLARQDSDVLQMKYHATFRRKLEKVDSAEGLVETSQRHYSSSSEEHHLMDKDISSSESSDNDDNGYLTMNPITENRFEMSGSSYGSPGSNLSTSFESHTIGSPSDSALKSSLKGLLPLDTPDKLEILGPVVEEVDPESDHENYELCSASTPRYVPKSSTKDSDVDGSYIEFKRTSQTDSGRGSTDSPPPLEEDSEVAKITGHKPPPDSLDIQHDRTYTAPSPNHYITLLPPSPKVLPKRSFTEIHSGGPPVPPRRSPRSSPIPERKKLPISHRTARPKTSEINNDNPSLPPSSDNPPPPPPRQRKILTGQASSPLLSTAGPFPSHRTLPSHRTRLSSPPESTWMGTEDSREHRWRSKSPPISPVSPTSPVHPDRFTQSFKDPRNPPPLPSHRNRLSSPPEPDWATSKDSTNHRWRSKSPPTSPVSSTSPVHPDRFTQSYRDPRTPPPLPPRV